MRKTLEYKQPKPPQLDILGGWLQERCREVPGYVGTDRGELWRDFDATHNIYQINRKAFFRELRAQGRYRETKSGGSRRFMGIVLAVSNSPGPR